MNVDISIWGILLALVFNFIVGMIWYSPKVFGAKWMGLVKLSKKDIQKKPDKFLWVKVNFGALLQAYVLAYSINLTFVYFRYSWLEASLVTAMFLWSGLQVSLLLVHDAFEKRPLDLTMINAGNQLASMLAMGLAIGLIRP